MSNVEQLVKNDEHIIQILEGAIEDVKSGEVVSLAVACTFKSGDTKSGFCALDAVMTLLGELTVLQRDIMDRCVESRKDDIGMQ